MRDTTRTSSTWGRIGTALNAVGTVAVICVFLARRALMESQTLRAHDAGETGPVSVAELLEAHPAASILLPLSMLVAVACALAGGIVAIVGWKVGGVSKGIYGLAWSGALFLAIVAVFVV